MVKIKKIKIREIKKDEDLWISHRHYKAQTKGAVMYWTVTPYPPTPQMPVFSPQDLWI